jgi:undecaprenyl-diphosphatase
LADLYIVLIVLGVVQGLAEFLPVSSSGHLAILEQIAYFKNVLGSFEKNINLFINVALHMATLAAVMIYLRKEIIRIVTGVFSGLLKRDFKTPEMKAAGYIIIASLPAGLIGIIFHDLIEQTFSSDIVVFILLIINGIILIFANKMTLKDRKLYETGALRSLFIGFFQAVAILPGISRSGMTITGGLANGLKPEEAFRFSFLMAIPVILGAGILEGVKAVRSGLPGEIAFPVLISMTLAFAFGLLALWILDRMMQRIRLYIFGIYTVLLGTMGTVMYLMK